MDKEIKMTFSFYSLIAAETEQDIETKEFSTKENMLGYILARLDFSIFKGVYVAIYTEDSMSDDSPLLITKYFGDIWLMFDNQGLIGSENHFFIYEFPGYKEALGYASTYFEV